MLIAAAPDPLVANFWAPVAQIVPVFGIALVIEARRAAVRWPEASHRRRLVQGAFLYSIAACLLITELGALFYMQTGQTSSSVQTLATVFLTTIFLVLIVVPLLDLFEVGSAGIPTMLWRYMPWSKFRRRRREREELSESLRRTKERLPLVATLEEEVIQKQEEIARTRKQLGDVAREQRRVQAEVRQYQESNAPVPTRLSSKVEELVKRTKNLLNSIEARQDLIRQARESVVGIESVRAEIEEAEREMDEALMLLKTRNMSPHEKARIDRMVVELARRSADPVFREPLNTP